MQTKTEEAIDAVKLAVLRLEDARKAEVAKSKEGHYLALDGARHWLEGALRAIYKATARLER